jgi:hypothetical protein
MPKTPDKLRDPISRKALIDAIQESANRHFKPLTPEREKRADHTTETEANAEFMQSPLMFGCGFAKVESTIHR